MRETKFRGKAIDSGEWTYGFILFTDDRAYIHPIRNGLDFDDIYFGYGFIQIIPETAGQFTGLRDKNGKEIYKNDYYQTMVSYEIGSGYIPTKSVVFVGEKHFHELAMRGILENTVNDIEVIGNIHETQSC